MENWYAHSFGADYLVVYKHRDMEKAAHEVRTMISWLGVPQDSEVLDLCCGMGRHAIALQKIGYQVTGIDLSASLLRVANELDVEQKVTWVQGDMRTVPFESSFDAVVNMFTSFGYFSDDAENKKVLQQIRKALKPGGKWLLDFLNPAYVQANLVPRSEREQEGYYIVETREIVDGFVVKKINVTRPDGSHGQYWERVKLYEREWFESACAQFGLKIHQIYGDYSQTPYSEHSPRFILVGEVD